MKKVTGVLKIILALFVVLCAGAAYLLFFADGGARAISAGSRDFGAFDLRISYTPDNLMTVLSAFDGDRQSAYQLYFIYDFVFLFCCAVVMMIIPVLINSVSSRHYIFYRLSIFSASFYTIFNVSENLLLMRIINAFPVFTDSDANLSSGCTTMKWVFLGLWLFGTIMFALLTAISSLRSKRKESSS